MARIIGNTDPELALAFLSATLPYVQSGLPDDDPEDHTLVVDLAAQVALHDPRRALQLAEQQLKELVDLPSSFIDLLQQVQRSDAQAGANLFRDVVDHLKQQNLAEDSEQLTFAISLLTDQFGRQSETGQNPDTPLRSLAEMVASAASISTFLQDQPFQLSEALPALDALVPAKSTAFHSPSQASARAHAGNKILAGFNQAQSSADEDKVLATLPHLPDDDRERISQQIAWNFAGDGDLQRTSNSPPTSIPGSATT